MSEIILLGFRIALMVALYAFLGWTVWLLWRDLKYQSNRRKYHLPPVILIQPDVEGDPQPTRFTAMEIVIGRDPSCDYPLNDVTVSAKHSRLTFHESQWWVEDLQSTNGTFLNNEPVNEPLVVTSGDRLRCGKLSFSLTIGEPSEN